MLQYFELRKENSAYLVTPVSTGRSLLHQRESTSGGIQGSTLASFSTLDCEGRLTFSHDDQGRYSYQRGSISMKEFSCPLFVLSSRWLRRWPTRQTRKQLLQRLTSLGRTSNGTSPLHDARGERTSWFDARALFLRSSSVFARRRLRGTRVVCVFGDITKHYFTMTTAGFL